MHPTVHFATLTDDKWINLCGQPGEQVHGTLVLGEDITCLQCRKLWGEGMMRVHALFKNYQGEE